MRIKSATVLFSAVLTLSFAVNAFATHLHKEKDYQAAWCNKVGGVMEYVLDDGTRVDCITNEHAIEFDFASKWAESVGQALYYAEMTGRRPGVVLILERPGDERYLARLKRLAERYGMTTWTMTPAEIEN